MKKIILSAAFIAVTTIAISAQTQITEKNGNVGINNTDPRAKLDVKGTSAVWSDFNNYNGTTVGSSSPNGKKPTLILSENPTGTFTPGVGDQVTYKGGMSFGNGGPGIYSINPNPAGSPYYGELRFHTTAWKDNKYYNADRMVIKLDGKIGIGTVTPNNNLDISNNATTRNVGVELDASHYTGSGISHAFMQFRTPNFKNDNTLTTGAAEIGLSNSNGAFYITRKTNVGVNADGIVLDKNANVGIGTLNPSAKLSVNGEIHKLTQSNGVDGNWDNLIKYGHQNDLESSSTNKNRWHGIDATITAGAAANNKMKFRVYGGSTQNLAPIDVMTLNGEGNVGIGTTSPSEKLDVNGIIKAKSVLKIDADGGSGFVSSRIFLNSHNDFRGAGIYSIGQTNTWFTGNPYTDHANAFIIGVAPSSTNPISGVAQKKYAKFYINKNGDTGIGTTDTKGYKLAVAGSSGIIAEKVTVKLQTAWPDYVFTNKYKLPTLKEVEQHIKEKGHLKNIPSAKEVAENGVELGAMNKKLLEKVEELTLYTIQQQKEIQKLKEQNKELEKLKVLVHQLIKSKKLN